MAEHNSGLIDNKLKSINTTFFSKTMLLLRKIASTGKSATKAIEEMSKQNV